MSRRERDVLRQEAYADPTKLSARQRLWSYAERVRDTSRITWALPLEGDETVVDLGCGNGNDLRGLRSDGHTGRLVALDFSLGMLRSVPSDLAERVAADAAALPLADGVADVVSAMHMLYHVDDIPAVLREATRVLGGSGVFLASTNSEHTACELVEPWSAAMVAAGGPPLERVSQRAFTLEGGEAILRRVFASVEVKRVEIVARVPVPEVVRDYVASTDDLYRPMLQDDAAWEQVVDAVAAHAAVAVARHGTFDITQRAGVFVCRA